MLNVDFLAPYSPRPLQAQGLFISSIAHKDPSFRLAIPGTITLGGNLFGGAGEDI
jgi:hypothetical protein